MLLLNAWREPMAWQIDVLAPLAISLWIRGNVVCANAKMSRWWKVDSGVRSAPESRNALPGILSSQSGNIPTSVERS